MKIFIYLLQLFVLTLCTSCQKPEWDLKRNNLNDNNKGGIILNFDSYTVASDNNGDKEINKGESIALKVFIKNSGTSTANKVKAVISTTSSYISNVLPSTSLSYNSSYLSDYINPGSSQYGDYQYKGYSLQFKVAASTPIGSVVVFNMVITDESGNSWNDSFSIIISDTKAKLNFDSYKVVSDNNGDKVINKGESIALKVYIKNSGTSTANKVKAVISTTSTYISNVLPSTSLSYNSSYLSDYIDSESSQFGDYQYKGYSLQFDVSASTPIGSVIVFKMVITDESGNTWNDSFSITITETNAKLKFDSYTVVSDNNGDKVINKGESIALKIYIKNTGTSTANKVKAVISTTSSYISNVLPSTSLSYNSSYLSDYIDTGYSQYGDYQYKGYSLQFNVSASTPISSFIVFKMVITDESGNTWNDSFSIYVN